MPQITVDISVEELAEIIINAKKDDLETLSLLLIDEGKELLKRKQDIESRRIKTLSRQEVFDA